MQNKNMDSHNKIFFILVHPIYNLTGKSMLDSRIDIEKTRLKKILTIENYLTFRRTTYVKHKTI